MKKAIIIFFIGISYLSFGQSDSVMENHHQNLSIQDIVETLSECNCMIMGMGVELTEKEKKYISRGQAIFFGRKFGELDSLYENGNNIIQLYAFGGICLSYPDSLSEKHLEILKNPDTVNIYVQGADQFPIVPISEIATGMHKAVEVIKKQKETKLIVEERVSDFIRKYSSNPNSYESIDFLDYRVHSYNSSKKSLVEGLEGLGGSSEIDDSKVHSIKHSYRINNNDGKLEIYSVRFKLDNNFNLMIIEEKESNITSSNPPRLDWWLKTFGRELSEEERSKLGIRND
jgi:hypothetical protein